MDKLGIQIMEDEMANNETRKMVQAQMTTMGFMDITRWLQVDADKTNEEIIDQIRRAVDTDLYEQTGASFASLKVEVINRNKTPEDFAFVNSGTDLVYYRVVGGFNMSKLIRLGSPEGIEFERKS